jgi:hypothetical protein
MGSLGPFIARQAQIATAIDRMAALRFHIVPNAKIGAKRANEIVNKVIQRVAPRLAYAKESWRGVFGALLRHAAVIASRTTSLFAAGI